MLISKLNRILRIPALIVLMFFLWTVAEPWNYDKNYAKAATYDAQVAMAEKKQQDQIDQYYKKQDKENGKLKAPQTNASVPEDKWPELMQRLDDAVSVIDPEGEQAAGTVNGKQAKGFQGKREPKMTAMEAELELDSVMSDIDAEEQNLRAELKSNRKMLEDMKASDELFQRQTDFENKIRMKMLEVKQAYNDIKGEDVEATNGKDKKSLTKAQREARKKERRKAGFKKMRGLLEEAKPKRLVELDPNNLPNQRITEKDIKKKEPRKGSKFGKLWRQKKIELVSADPYGILGGAQAAYDLNPVFEQVSYRPDMPPDAEDLKSTIETEATPDIIDLAENQLSCDPVQMYNWVHNNIDFVPYYGSMKGANETLWQGEGNDMDQASLLIAMYRHCGIPARYVVGTVEVPIDKAMNWAGGFTDAESAYSAYKLGGIPLSPIFKGGKFTAIRMEHAWIEAWLSEERYRGAENGNEFSLSDPFSNGRTWMQLDASYKSYWVRRPIDISSITNFPVEQFIQRTTSMGTINNNESYVTGFDPETILSESQSYYEVFQDYIATSDDFYKNTDILGVRSIEDKNNKYNKDAIDLKVVGIIDRMSDILNPYRYYITFGISSQNSMDFNDGNEPISVLRDVKLNFINLVSKRISLSFHAESEKDLMTLRTLNEINSTSIPVYLIKIVPKLFINSDMVGIGNGIEYGKKVLLQIKIHQPTNSTKKDNGVIREIKGGATYGLMLDVGRISETYLGRTRQALKQISESNTPNLLLPHEVASHYACSVIATYFYLLDKTNQITANINDVLNVRSPSIGMTIFDIYVYSRFGLPIYAKEAGMLNDVFVNVYGVFSYGGNDNSQKIYTLNCGYHSSALESFVFELIFRQTYPNAPQAISSIYALTFANNNNIPIYVINKDNVDNLIDRIECEPDMKAEITNYVASGNTVIIPQKEVNIESWNGFGYIVIDPYTGGANYLISGGYSGGLFFLALIGLMVTIVCPPLGAAILFIAGVAAAYCFGRAIDEDGLLNDLATGVFEELGKDKEVLNYVLITAGLTTISASALAPFILLAVFELNWLSAIDACADPGTGFVWPWEEDAWN